MINKKISFLILFFVFLFSSYTSYSYFKYQPSGLISPVSLYQPPIKSENGEDAQAINNEPKTEICPLNGQLSTKSQKEKWEKRRPLAIMIENHKEARPQSGLQSADVIFEAVAEGGITRFLAIYYCNDAKYVGPIRSARIYFIKLLEGFGNYPLYAHVGGANTPGPADALGYIKKLGWVGYNDLNQFSVPFPYFWRDYERLPNRATEHTVYSSTSKLWDYAKIKRGLTEVDEDGNRWDKNFVGWQFKENEIMDKRETIEKIEFGFWNSFVNEYNVIWNYVKDKNVYLRINGGAPHLDKNTGKQLEAKNVVIVFANEMPANDGYPGGHILYQLTGKGQGLLFQDGRAMEVFWQRKDENQLIRFYEENGKEISFVGGLIFIEILPIGNKVIY